MESNKSKMLRIVKTIYDIKPKTIVQIDDYVGMCKCIDDIYDIYHMQKDNYAYGISASTLNDMREALLVDFLKGYYKNIKIL